jgi:ubiquinol-cytochrome c reductase subunit 6
MALSDFFSSFLPTVYSDAPEENAVAEPKEESKEDPKEEAEEEAEEQPAAAAEEEEEPEDVRSRLSRRLYAGTE